MCLSGRSIKRKNLVILIALIILVILVIISIFYALLNKDEGVKNRGYYYIDEQGNILNLDSMSSLYSNGFKDDGYALCSYIFVKNENTGVYDIGAGIIDTNGKIVGDRVFDSNDIVIGNDTAFPIVVHENGNAVIYGEHFEIIAQVENDDNANVLGSNYGFSEGLGDIVLKFDDKCLGGYVNTNGEWVIEPKYEKCRPFTKDGIAAVQNPESSLWGFIDSNGNELFDEWFYDVSDFSEGFALVQKDEDGKAAYINTKGEYITDFIFDYKDSQHGFSEGLAYVKLYGEKQYGYINEHGDMVIAPQYMSAGKFSCDLAPVGVFGRGDIYIDKNEKEVIDLDIDVLGYAFTKDGYATVYDFDKGKFGIIDTKGEWLFKPQFIDYTGTLDSYSAPKLENGYCLVYLEEGQSIKKAKKR